MRPVGPRFPCRILFTELYRQTASRSGLASDPCQEAVVDALDRLSVAAAPEDLYADERLAFEFRRTASRLQEMQARAYLGLSHRASPVPRRLPGTPSGSVVGSTDRRYADQPGVQTQHDSGI